MPLALFCRLHQLYEIVSPYCLLQEAVCGLVLHLGLRKLLSEPLVSWKQEPWNLGLWKGCWNLCDQLIGRTVKIWIFSLLCVCVWLKFFFIIDVIPPSYALSLPLESVTLNTLFWFSQVFWLPEILSLVAISVSIYFILSTTTCIGYILHILY